MPPYPTWLISHRHPVRLWCFTREIIPMALNVDKTALTSSADSTLYDQTIKKWKGERQRRRRNRSFIVSSELSSLKAARGGKKRCGFDAHNKLGGARWIPSSWSVAIKFNLLSGRLLKLEGSNRKENKRYRFRSFSFSSCCFFREKKEKEKKKSCVRAFRPRGLCLRTRYTPLHPLFFFLSSPLFIYLKKLTARGEKVSATLGHAPPLLQLFLFSFLKGFSFLSSFVFSSLSFLPWCKEKEKKKQFPSRSTPAIF